MCDLAQSANVQVQKANCKGSDGMGNKEERILLLLTILDGANTVEKRTSMEVFPSMGKIS